jgi:CubicO group peptidase (beta-lactamase class C family)
MSSTSRRSVTTSLGYLALRSLVPQAAWAGADRLTESQAMSINSLKLLGPQIGGIFEAHIASGYMPGAVALVGQGEQADIVIVGRQSFESDDPMRPDSLFRIASMTKPVAAVAALMLIDEGRLRLHEPIDHWLPELAHRRVLRNLQSDLTDTVPAVRPISVFDLLTFRCGWGYLPDPPQSCPILRRIEELRLVGFGPPDPSSILKPDEWIRRLGTLPLMAQPGEAWIYNTGSYILGVLLARASGQSLPELLQRRIFEPLGMRSTGFYVPESQRKRLVTAYRPEGGRSIRYDDPAHSAWGSPPAFPDAGAGLISCVDDYQKFARMLLDRGRHNGRSLVSDASLAALMSDQLTDAQRQQGLPILGEGRGWGLGLSVVHARSAQGLPVGAVGWNGGLGTSWIADPASARGVIVLTQTAFASPVPPTVHQEVWRAVFSPPVL